MIGLSGSCHSSQRAPSLARKVSRQITKETQSWLLDVKVNEIAPRWPPILPKGSFNEPKWEMSIVDTSSISFVVNRIYKVSSLGPTLKQTDGLDRLYRHCRQEIQGCLWEDNDGPRGHARGTYFPTRTTRGRVDSIASSWIPGSLETEDQLSRSYRQTRLSALWKLWRSRMSFLFIPFIRCWRRMLIIVRNSSRDQDGWS